MPAPKLTDEHQDALREWLCGGLSNVACIERLKTEFGVEVTQPAINYYRDKHSEEIAEAEEAAYKHVIQQGMTRRSERIKTLAKLAERTAAKLDEDGFKPGSKGWTFVSAELRAQLKDLRDEMDKLTQRIEISGPGGGPVQVVPIFSPDDPLNHINDDNTGDEEDDEASKAADDEATE